ncbi:MAG TPA: tryptophan-rich sensory protein [Phycisphaerae bacterium]|nr:tryptophan-rich sensory protein [Phycisphaerae bacterium]HRY70950.1 tryptophan-rich sensory protein [Phycisphaerae bacterium]HSA29189.1 tryptophan-rich sensory protein [Phycisphaerae bacterium]
MRIILYQGAVLVLCVVVCFAAAAIGAAVTGPSVPGWYASLNKPSWTPPSWVFGPVWSLLYLLMGISAWQVWRRTGLRAATVPLALFGIQLLLNAAWSGLFFGLRSPGAALLDIVLLWCAILGTVIAFWRRSAPAGWLMLPYLAWVSFAVALNLAIWNLN